MIDSVYTQFERSYPQNERICSRRFRRVIHKLICVGAALFDEVGDLGYLVVDRTTLFHEVSDLLIGVHHRRVIAAVEQLADFWQREIGHLTAEVHSNLSGSSNCLSAG